MPIPPRYRVTLPQPERDQLELLGRVNAKKLLADRMLLLLFLLTLLAAPALPETSDAPKWRGLTVALECDCSVYDQDDYGYSSRKLEALILKRQGGRICSPYTGICYPSDDETDVEHIVARKQAHLSGLCDPERADERGRFAEDLDNLTLAEAHLNRYIKSDKDAGRWMPTEARCWFAQTVVAVKRKWALTVDKRERDALERTLIACELVGATATGSANPSEE